MHSNDQIIGMACWCLTLIRVPEARVCLQVILQIFRDIEMAQSTTIFHDLLQTHVPPLKANLYPEGLQLRVAVVLKPNMPKIIFIDSTCQAPMQ